MEGSGRLFPVELRVEEMEQEVDVDLDRSYIKEICSSVLVWHEVSYFPYGIV